MKLILARQGSAEALATAVIRSALKTITVTQLVWGEQVQLLVMGDLIYGSGETYLIEGAHSLVLPLTTISPFTRRC